MLRSIGLIWLLTLALACPAATLELDINASRVNLNDRVEYFEDATGAMDIEEVQAIQQSWAPNGNDVFNQSYSDSAWWLRLRITNPREVKQERLIELSYAVLDYLDVYITSPDGVLYHYPLGDKYPFYQRALDHRFFIVPVEWQPLQTLEIYYRIKTSSSVQAPLTLWQNEEFFGFDATRTILQGIFFGAMLVIAIYNMLIYLVLGERTYILYVGYVLSMPLFLASLGGHSFRFFWPTFTEWNDQSIIVFLASVIFFGTAFTRRFLDVRAVQPALDKALMVLVWCGALIVLCAFVLPYRVNIRILIPVASIACIACFGAGIYCWRHGQSAAKFYTIAWGSMLSGGLILALNKVGLIPSNLFTEYATHIGSALEVVLLSFALAERINEERRLRYAAQDNALATTRRMNEELEGRVQERTRELEALTTQLRELSNTDQLTGLHNRRYLDDLLLEEWERARRYQRKLAVILLDIDHFKQVNDVHGHLVGDECLREMAIRIRNGLRWPSDQAARFGGEEFCVVLPETTVEGAMTVAERIRMLIECQPVATTIGSLPLTVSAGVCALIPDTGTSITQLLKIADQALYAAKEAGRNRVHHSDKLRVVS